MKRLPTTSADVEIAAMANAGKPYPEPPAHVTLRDGDRPFWDAILRARARDEWTEADLPVAAQLARCQADIEREQMALDAESTVVENAKGTLVMNARCTVLERLAGREMALMRCLRMGGTVAGDPKLEQRRREADRRVAAVHSELEGEELLA